MTDTTGGRDEWIYVVTDIEVDEVFIVLSGSATLTFDDGEVIELSSGVTVHLRAGDRTTWTVHEPLRKVYVAGP